MRSYPKDRNPWRTPARQPEGESCFSCGDFSHSDRNSKHAMSGCRECKKLSNVKGFALDAKQSQPNDESMLSILLAATLTGSSPDNQITLDKAWNYEQAERDEARKILGGRSRHRAGMSPGPAGRCEPEGILPQTRNQVAQEQRRKHASLLPSRRHPASNGEWLFLTRKQIRLNRKRTDFTDL